MKKAEDFRREMGPVDSGFHTVFCKTLEELQAKGQKNPGKKPIVIYPARVRIIAAAAALVLLVGAGILGITSRTGGLEPVDKIRGQELYTSQPVATVLAQATEPVTGGADVIQESFPENREAFDPEKDIAQMPRVILPNVCSLPDGRLLLVGTERISKDIYNICKARMICLNPDRTVSWEYTGPEEYSDFLWFDQVTVLKDGTIAVKHDGSQKRAIQFFTPEGVLLNEKTLGTDDSLLLMEPSFLALWKMQGEDSLIGIEDWDGNEITRIAENRMFTDGFSGLVREDELVLFGKTRERKSHAKIVKMDGLTDKILWETVLDYQWEDSDGIDLNTVKKTEDGGYAALVWEWKFGAKEEEDTVRPVLVKLAADGTVQWVSKDDQPHETIDYDLYTHNGKIAVMFDTTSADNAGGRDINIPIIWFDETGKALGTTELTVKPEYYAVLGQKMGSPDSSLPRSLKMNDQMAVSMPNGLWAYLSGYVGIYYADTNELDEDENSRDTILIRIPEPAGVKSSPSKELKEPVLLGDNELTEEKCLAMKEFLKPLNLSCEDRGIRIELLSGFAKGNEAWFQYTMKVLDEDKASNKSIPFFDCDFGSEKQQDSLLLNHDTTRQELTYCAVIQFDEPIDFSDRTVMVSLCQWSDESRSQKQGNWEYQFLLSRIAAEDSNK